MLTNSYQLAQDFWEYIPAMTITDCCYFPLCLSYWCCPMISDDRRKFRSQISDNMDRWKAEMGRVREEKRREEERRSKKIKAEKVRRKKIQVRAKKVGKSRNIVFPMICGSGWSRVGSLKRRVRGASWPDERWKIARRCGAKRVPKSKCTKHTKFGSTFWSWDVEKVHALWRKAHFQVKMYKTHQVRSTFGSWDVEKVRAAVARRAFPSQNVQNPSCPEHFWKFRYRKKCTPLWRKAHFQVKMLKALHVRSTFGGWDVERVHAAVARRAFPS